LQFKTKYVDNIFHRISQRQTKVRLSLSLYINHSSWLALVDINANHILAFLQQLKHDIPPNLKYIYAHFSDSRREKKKFDKKKFRFV